MSDRGPSTPKQTGSHVIAEARRAYLGLLADALDSAAAASARRAGRPDLAMARLAKECRQHAATFAEWRTTRLDMGVRGEDLRLYEELLRQARALGVTLVG